MKDKLIIAVTAALLSVPVWAQVGDFDSTVPEPSTIALFASAALAIVLARKFRR